MKKILFIMIITCCLFTTIAAQFYAENRDIPKEENKFPSLNSQLPTPNSQLTRNPIEVYIGDPESTYRPYNPFSFIWGSSLVQTIYREEDFTENGLITNISYDFNHVDIPDGLLVKMWIRPTTMESFGAGEESWLLWDNDWIEVFDGIFPSTGTGQQIVNFSLDTPYLYTGGNIVIMTQRFLTTYYIGGNTFLNTEVSDVRTSFNGSDSFEFDHETVNSGGARYYFANTIFGFQAANSNQVYIGDIESTYRPYNPFSFIWGSSLVQTIYRDEDITESGLLTSIGYDFNHADIPEGLLVKMWIRPTTMESFGGVGEDWILWDDEWVEVYDDVFPFIGTGLQIVDLPLQTPYLYTGGNIVIMAQRFLTPYYGGQNTFLNTEVSDVRTSFNGSDSFEFDHETVTSGGARYYFPNTILSFESTGFGILSGIVTAENIPIEGVTITINEIDRVAISNENGEYLIDYLLPDTYSITASMPGYVDITIENIIVTAEMNTTQDIEMEMATTVIISGVVIGSDTDLPVEGATVIIGGPATFPAVITNDLGEFFITDVFVNQIYTLTIEAEGYKIYFDDNIIVGVMNISLGEIIIFEQTTSPSQVQIVNNITHTTITWQPPDINTREFLETYNLYRAKYSDLANEANWTQIISNLPETHYNDPSWANIEIGGDYVYIVKAVFTNDNLSEGAVSNILRFTAPNEVYIGDPYYENYSPFYPFNMGAQESIFQAIYLNSEIPLEGVIESITWDFNNYNAPALPISIWLANVDEDYDYFPSLSDWVPLDQFTLVFEGELPIQPFGWGQMRIDFQNPFIYDGGNLVVMTHRLWTPLYPGNNNQFRQMNAPYRHLKRERDHDGSNPFDLENLPPSLNWNYYSVPTITLSFNTEGFGSLAGIVTVEDEPLDGVIISINGRNVLSNSFGEYLNQYVLPGAYTVTATKIGYEATIEDVTIIEGETTSLSIEMSSIEMVSISGVVLASDTGLPIENANVILTGYATLPMVTTAENGVFIVPDVYVNNEYNLYVNAAGYNPYYDNNIFVGLTNLTLENITLSENTAPPRMVLAVNNHTHTTITWLPPLEPDPENNIFTHSTSEDWGSKWRHGTTGVRYETGHRYTAAQLQSFGVAGTMLTHLEFMPGGEAEDWSVRVYIGGNGLNPGTMVHEQFVNDVVYEEWNSVLLTTPIFIPIDSELWFTFLSTEIDFNSSHCMDEGPIIPGFGSVFRPSISPAFYPSHAYFTGNWMIRGRANTEEGLPVMVQPISYSIIEQLGVGVDFSASVGNALMRSASGTRNGIIFPKAEQINQFPTEGERINSRSFENMYNLYRAKVSEATDEALWTTIATNISETSYDDTSWLNIQESDDYIYIVKGISTNNVLSSAAVSNALRYHPPNEVYIGWAPAFNFYASDGPFKFSSANENVTQSIYLDSEITLSGFIEGVKWEFRNISSYPTPIKIWIANVGNNYNDFTNENGWVPYNQFTLVYDGDFPSLPMGYCNLEINFDTPFAYDGGNIVIMTQKLWDPIWNPYSPIATNEYRYTYGRGNLHVTRQAEGLTNPLDPANLPAGTISLAQTHITLVFSDTGTGNLIGTTTYNEAPLADVLIEIEGTDISTTSNAEGLYQISNIPEGNINIIATKHGFYDNIIEGVLISEAENTILPIVMEFMPLVTVTGSIIGSGTDEGLEGALIDLTGYNDYHNIITNGDGFYTIPDVIANQTYTITIRHLYYEKYIDEEINIPDIDYTIPVIIMTEKIPAPSNLQAVIDETSAILTWEAPEFGEEIWFSHITSTGNDNYMQYGVAGVWFETGHRYTAEHLAAFGVAGAELTMVEFKPRTDSPDWKVRVYHGGSAAGPEEMVAEIDLPTIVADVWNLVILPTPIQIPTDDELWLTFYSTDGLSFHGRDAGPAHPDGYGNMRRSQVNPAWSPQWGQNTNWQIRGFAEGAMGRGYISHVMLRDETSSVMLRNETSPVMLRDETSLVMLRSPEERRNLSKEILHSVQNDNIISETGLTEPKTSISKWKSEISATDINNIRALTGYRIDRTHEDYIEDETMWTLINENVTELSYTDPLWGDVVGGIYHYIVRAVYSSDVLSEPIFSGPLEAPIVSEIDLPEIPLITILKGNYPNPFNPSTMITFDKATDGNVKIDIYNIKGQKVKSLLNSHTKAGSYSIEWYGVNDNEMQVGSGIYFYRMETNEYTSIRKMILLK